MRLKLVQRDHEARLCGLDHRVHDARGHNLADAHCNQLPDADLYARSARRDIKPDRHKAEKDREEDDRRNDDENGNYEFWHDKNLPELRLVLCLSFLSLAGKGTCAPANDIPFMLPGMSG